MNNRFLSPGRLGGFLAIVIWAAAVAPVHATTVAPSRDLASVPPGLVAAIAQTQAGAAAEDPALAIGHNGCSALHSGLRGCFAAAGPRFASGKDHVALQLAAWGWPGHLVPVALRRGSPTTDRIAYRGEGVSEWWRALPMGYEQGFTLKHAPKGHGEVILQLQASRVPRLEHGILAWGALRYGKLQVVDATGKALPSRLSAHGKTIVLAFDGRHAQYPVRIDPMVWLQNTLLASNGASGDAFGHSVAIDTAGTTAVVGAVGANGGTGAAYVYSIIGGTWTQVAELTGPSSSEFGWAVALSSNGTTAVVGAPLADGGSGAFYVFTEPGAGWSGTIASTGATASLASPNAGLPGEFFATSLALSNDGNTALVGTNGSLDAAYVYTAATSGGWASTTTYSALLTDGGSGNLFGYSVALSGDGATALVGAYGTLTKTGRADVFAEPAGGWTGTLSTPTATLGDPDGNTGDEFGYSVALSNDGSTALIGAIGVGASGEAYVFVKPGTAWLNNNVANATLTDGSTTTSDAFGDAVALDGTGSTALVGANATNGDAGAAYVFTEPSSGWVTPSAASATFANPGGSSSDYFGNAVALDTGGTAALVGAPDTQSSKGAAYAFAPSFLSATLNVPASVAASTQYEADYIVTNEANTTSGDVVVALPVPSGASYVGISASQGTCAYVVSGPYVLCDLGAIARSGTAATAYLSLKSGTAPGTISQTASLANGSPNLAQSASTTVTASGGSTGGGTNSGSGGGGAFGLWTLLGLVGLAGAVRARGYHSIRRG